VYSATDGSLDQETYYSYDGDGRVLHEYIEDDSGRVMASVESQGIARHSVDPLSRRSVGSRR